MRHWTGEEVEKLRSAIPEADRHLYPHPSILRPGMSAEEEAEALANVRIAGLGGIELWGRGFFSDTDETEFLKWLQALHPSESVDRAIRLSTMVSDLLMEHMPSTLMLQLCVACHEALEAHPTHRPETLAKERLLSPGLHDGILLRVARAMRPPQGDLYGDGTMRQVLAVVRQRAKGLAGLAPQPDDEEYASQGFACNPLAHRIEEDPFGELLNHIPA